jgi:hypothetical protein
MLVTITFSMIRLEKVDIQLTRVSIICRNTFSKPLFFHFVK